MITFIDRGAVGTFNYGKSRIEVDEEHNWSRQPKHLTDAGTFNNGENGNAIVKGKTGTGACNGESNQSNQLEGYNWSRQPKHLHWRWDVQQRGTGTWSLKETTGTGACNGGSNQSTQPEGHNWSRQLKHSTGAGSFNDEENGNTVVEEHN